MIIWHLYSSYSTYHRRTDACTTALFPTKPSSDGDSGFRHGFGAEASLPLARSASAVSHDTIRLCQIVVILWDWHIHAVAIRDLSWILSIYFHLSDGGIPILVKKTEIELAMKALHPTLIGNTFVIQPYYIFPTYADVHSRNIYIYIYFFKKKKNIYIYIYISLKKDKTGHIGIINLFPSCHMFLI